MTGGIPKEDSYERIMGLVNTDELNKILFDFFYNYYIQTRNKCKSFKF